jgi:hypothetical protein
MMTRETTKRLLTAGSVMLVVAIIAGYAYFASSGLIDGPRITITSPSSGTGNGGKGIGKNENGNVVYADISTSTVVISGIAQRVNSLILDGRPIVIDTQGNFSQTLLLFPGYNIETLQGQDRFGRTTHVDFEITYNLP